MSSPAVHQLPAGLAMGPVTLRIPNLDRSLTFYQQVMGMQLLARETDRALVGVDTPLLELIAQPDALPRNPRMTGLFHFAILLPTRQALGAWLAHLETTGYPLGGFADHQVSEALYLTDPDGNGIEVYRDRPRSDWLMHAGQVQMGSDPIDLDELVRDGTREGGNYAGMPIGTTMGHVHLQIADVETTRTFYVEQLGFDLMQEWRGALFVSAGGYHHHLGLNIWNSRGGATPPPTMVGLHHATILLPQVEDITTLTNRLAQHALAHEVENGALLVTDPSGNHLRFAVR